MTDSDTKEAIELQIDIAKEILQQLISQPDVAELVAKAARIQYEAFIAQGFGDASALTLTAATLSKQK